MHMTVFGNACFISFILLCMLNSWEASCGCICVLLLLLRLVARKERHRQTNIILNFISNSKIFSAQLFLSIKPKYLHETQTYRKNNIVVSHVETQKLSVTTNPTCQESSSITSPQLQVFRLLSLRAALLVQ